MTRKKSKPSFDIDRPPADRGTAWVYRSEEGAGEPPSAPPPPAPPAPAERVQPGAVPASGGGALDLLVMPVALALTVALAPVQWLRGRRWGTGGRTPPAI